MPYEIYTKDEMDKFLKELRERPNVPIPEFLEPDGEPPATWSGDNPLIQLPSMTSDKGFRLDATWTRQVATMQPGWEPFQGRWYKNKDLSNPIGNQPTETFGDKLQAGDTLRFLEWFRNADGEVFIAVSGNHGPMIEVPASDPPPAAPPVLDQIVSSMRAHEQKPFVQGNNRAGWQSNPWQIVASSRFRLHGSVMMPPWGSFSRRAELQNSPFNRLSTWNQLFLLADPANLGRTLHRSFGTAAMLSAHDVLCWHGGNKYSRPFNTPTDETGWMAAFWYDFRGNATLDAKHKVVDGKVVVKPSDNGQQVFHGGSPGATNINDWEPVKGVIVRTGIQLVNWDGSPVSDAQEAGAYLGFSVGCDAQPVGSSVASHFQPAGYIPGVGCGGFIRVLRERRFAYFCTLTAEELKAFPPPL